MNTISQDDAIKLMDAAETQLLTGQKTVSLTADEQKQVDEIAWQAATHLEPQA